LNFSLFLRGRSNFSLFGWISHFVAADAPISHLWFEFLTLSPHTLQFLTFGLNFSLFQRSSHFSLASWRAGVPWSQHDDANADCEKNIHDHGNNTMMMMVATTFLPSLFHHLPSFIPS
jgi:hypothetical protein